MDFAVLQKVLFQSRSIKHQQGIAFFRIHNIFPLRHHDLHGPSVSLHKVGPLPVISGVITPISRVITPDTHLFSAIYRGPITLSITTRGPPCRHFPLPELQMNPRKIGWLWRYKVGTEPPGLIKV